jgi:hypothetical protein
MATGPHHYHEAERLLATVSNDEGRVARGEASAAVLAAALVHATLALAAATALAPGTGEETGPDYYAWLSAAASAPKGDGRG